MDKRQLLLPRESKQRKDQTIRQMECPWLDGAMPLASAALRLAKATEVAGTFRHAQN